MSGSFNLQTRLHSLSVVPATIAALALLFLSVKSFQEGSSIVGTGSAVAAVIVVGYVGMGISKTSQMLKETVSQSIERAQMAASGQVLVDTVPSEITEFAALEQSLFDLAAQQKIVRAQSEALAAGVWDSPVLDTPTPGPLGPALRGSIEGLRKTTHALHDSQAVTSTLMNNVSDAIVVVASDKRLLAQNNVAQVALELYGGDLDDAVPGWQQLEIGEHEFSRNGPDNSLMLTQVSVNRVMTAGGAVTLLCWRDMSGERAVQAQIAHVANTDIVTGLPNRHGLLSAYDRLADMAATASLIHIDLANFASVNQRFGFPAGDHVLQVVSDRLGKVIRDDDTVARVSGDEFVLVLESQSDNVEALAKRILDRIAEPIVVDAAADTKVTMSAHAGWSNGTVDPDYELLRRAAYALAEAKHLPGAVSSYSDEVAERDESRRKTENELRDAIANDEFRLYAQPIVDVFEHRVLGVEIFLRWQHPSGRVVSPGEFLDIAEDADLMADIDRWVVQRCVEEAAKSDPSIVFSLNVSSRFMASSRMAEYVMATLTRSGLPAGRIQIDVTETNVATDVAGVIDSIKRLNAMGVKVALDDFGTGYSSLAHLLKLAVSTIKIDRRMVGLVTEPEGRGVVAAILAFARKRSLEVVAEGVESAEEVAELTELGCRYQQGYYHGHPAPLDELLASLDSIGSLETQSVVTSF